MLGRTPAVNNSEVDPTPRIRVSTGRSTNGVGCRFQLYGINDLEMVDQTGIEPVTS